MLEEWRNIDERYQVSSLGRVKSLFRGKEKILKSSKTSAGYEQVILCINNKRDTKRVHYLVAKYFIGEREDNLVINHKDRDRCNNMLYNLEICTQRHNRKHAFFGQKRFVNFNKANGRFKVGIRNQEGFQEFKGDFDTKEEAYEAAYMEYKKMYGVYPWRKL